MNVSDMKLLLISVHDDESILDRLNSMEGWSVEPLNIPGSFDNCLVKNGVKIAIRPISKSTYQTSSVMPHDFNHDVASANAAIDDLVNSLEESGIAYGECTPKVIA